MTNWLEFYDDNIPLWADLIELQIEEWTWDEVYFNLEKDDWWE